MTTPKPIPPLLDYLNLIDRDAVALKAHNENPQAAMTNFGLTQVEQAAIHSGDKQIVADIIGIPNVQYGALETLEIGY
ncbi:hypothetical protein [Undibacterium sp. TJN19]|uniref:hypothetical protein n=1 Tax=Undibacterium sp. TJN19 TaxID=3413055 RepID=UPI003BF255E1